MIQAQAQTEVKGFVDSDAHYEGLKARLSSREMTRMSHAEVEELLRVEGNELLRLLLQDHLDLRAREEQEAPPLRVVGAEGIERRHHRDTDRKLESLFGEVQVNRIAFGARGHTSLHPLDAELNLPADRFSMGVRRRVATEAAKVSFDEVVNTIDTTTGAAVAKRQAEELAQAAAVDFDAFYAQRTPAAGTDSSTVLALSFDGKGVVMRTEDLREQTKKKAQQRRHKMKKRLSTGEKKHAKRMATVAAVYTIAPFVRTPLDIVRELRPPETREEPPPKRPRPECKRVWARLEKEPETVMFDAFSDAKKRDPALRKQWVALVDGQPVQLAQVQRTARKFGVWLTVIVDLIHVIEYLWRATTAFNKAASPEAEAWVTERLLRILQGKAVDVAAGMRRSATLRALAAEDRAAVDDAADYLLKCAPYLRYDQYLARGYPIATGVIEGACRHLINDRLDVTGARWGLAGAEAVLRLRSLRSSGDFDEYWVFHARMEWQRNHASRFQGGVAPVRPPVRGGRAHLRLVN